MPRRFICGVPNKDCKGSPSRLGPSGLNVSKTHMNENEVYACQGRFLMSKGYKKLSRREYEAPNGGPITVLSKHPASLRTGKKDDKSAVSNCWTPLGTGKCGVVTDSFRHLKDE